MGEDRDESRSAAIRTLNDRFRHSLTGGAVVVTAGIASLDEQVQQAILQAVRRFDRFDEDNDPWREHDFGQLTVAGEQVFFKIDYYDRTRARHSPNPADPDQTERVMTIMLADEY